MSIMFNANVVVYEVSNKLITSVFESKNTQTKANKSLTKQKISRGYSPPDEVIVKSAFKETIVMVNYDWHFQYVDII